MMDERVKMKRFDHPKVINQSDWCVCVDAGIVESGARKTTFMTTCPSLSTHQINNNNAAGCTVMIPN